MTSTLTRRLAGNSFPANHYNDIATEGKPFGFGILSGRYIANMVGSEPVIGCHRAPDSALKYAREHRS